MSHNPRRGGNQDLLFDDTSYGPPSHNMQPQGPGLLLNPGQGQQYHQQPNHQNPGQGQGQGQGPPGMLDPSQFMNNPVMADMAFKYGSNLAETGASELNKRFDRFMNYSRLKHYFSVDTNYVAKKLIILLFPFKHRDWAVQFSADEPIPPRYDINTPDLYIPAMSYLTYILIAGVCLGTKGKFTPEDLGVLGSSALVWYLLELFLLYVLTFILNVTTSFRSFIDLLAFCGYKYLGMLLILLASLFAGSLGFYALWVYTSATISYFLMKTMRLCILSNVSQDQYNVSPAGSKRKWYFLLTVAASQPLLSYWLTYHVAAS